MLAHRVLLIRHQYQCVREPFLIDKHTRTRKQIKRYWSERSRVKPDAPAFASQTRGTHLRFDGLVQLMERLRNRSGVVTCTAHTFRRTFAISCLRNCMNIYVLARLMGHADITILRQYLPLVENDLQEAHARFGPWTTS